MTNELGVLGSIESNKYLVFSIVSFIVVCLLMFAYYSKKRVVTKTSKLFVVLMYLSFMNIGCEIIGNFILPLFNTKEIVIRIFAHIYLILLQTFVAHMVMYTDRVCNDLTGKKRSEKVEKILFYTFVGTSWIVLSIAPVELVWNDSHNQILFITGLCSKYAFWYCVSYLFCAVYCVLRSQVSVKMKELIPIYFYCLIGLAVGFFYRYNNSFIFLSFGLSLILFTMYLTVQNPDLHLVENLNVQKETADRANAAKSNFLSSMSHEIRTPLNAIVGLSEEIMLEEDLPDAVKEDASDMVSASKTLLEIINNIMDINKIESGKMEVILEPYNIRDELRPIIQELVSQVSSKVSLSINFAEDIPYTLLGDKNHLKTIIRNLVTNSIKFTKEGHINVNIKCINNFVTNESYLMISVEDTGEGIRSEDIQTLFDKYRKVDVRRDNTISGAGLGLAITKSLLELMGGSINVQSQFGIGSIFVAQLPQKIAETKDEEESIPDTIDFSGKSILLVDDNSINLKIGKRILESFNMTVTDCQSGQDCINLIRQGKKYDVIFLDMMMPNLTGLDTFAILSKTEGFNTPVMIITADESFGAEEKYLNEGFADYVPKPFNKEVMYRKLNKLFKNGRSDTK